MKNTGKKLKAARESQRVSINEVSMATKISPRMIQAIEDGDVNALPAKTFLRGFVQSYASYLKLDVDELLEVFHEEMGSTLPETRPIENSSIDEEREEKKAPPLLHEKSIWPKVIGGAVILLLVFIIIGVKNIIEKYEREANTVPAPTDLTSIQSPKEVETEEVTKKLEKPKTEDKQIVAESPPEKTPIPEPQSELKPAVESPSPSASPEIQTQPKTPKPTPKIKNEIIVEALDIVEIEFRVGSGDLKRVSLKPNQIHTIKAFGPIMLDLSDGGAVNLIHNGQDKGVPGDLGKPKKIKIQ